MHVLARILIHWFSPVILVLAVAIVSAGPSWSNSQVQSAIGALKTAPDGNRFTALPAGINCTDCHIVEPVTKTATTLAATNWKVAFYRDMFNTLPDNTILTSETYQARIRQYMESSDYSPSFTGPASFNVNKDPIGIDVPLQSSGGRLVTGGTAVSPVFTVESASVPGFAITGGNRLTRTTANIFGSVTVTLSVRTAEGLGKSNPQQTITINLLNNRLPNASSDTQFSRDYAVATSGGVFDVTLKAIDPDGDAINFENLQQLSSNGGSATASTNFLTSGRFRFRAPATVGSGYAEQYRVTIGNADGTKQDYNFTVSAILGTNNPPTALNKVFKIREDQSVRGVFATDPDAGANLDIKTNGKVLSVGQVIKLAHGSITIEAGNKFLYTPNRNDTASDGFVFEIFDGQFRDFGSVAFVKAAVDDPPRVKAPQRFALPDIEVESGEQVSTRVNLQSFIGDPDSRVSSLSYRIVKFIDTLSGDASRKTFGTYDNVNDDGTIPGGVFTFRNKPDKALEFIVQFRVAKPGVIPSSASCVNGIELLPNCGEVTIKVLLNGRGKHSISEREALANELGTKYENITLSGLQPHFPQSNVREACFNCHNPKNVETPAPNCGPTFFNALGGRLCRIRPFQEDLPERVNDAIMGIMDDGEKRPSFEPSVTLEAGKEVVSVPRDTPVGTKIGGTLKFKPGLTLDGDVSTILKAFIKQANARQYFGVAFSADRSSARLKVIKPLTDLKAGSTLFVTVLPVNDGRRRDATGKPVKAPGFFPNLIPAPAIRIDIGGGTLRLADDGPFTTTARRSIDIDVTANDSGDVAQPEISRVSRAKLGSVEIVNGKLRYRPSGKIGEDQFTYRLKTSSGESTEEATVTVLVAEDIALQPQPDETIVHLGSTTIIPVLDNDPGPRPSRITIKRSDQPRLGDAKVEFGAITYTGKKLGRDTFTYVVHRNGQSAEAKVTVVVVNVSEDAFADATRDPALKSVAKALGQSCSLGYWEPPAGFDDLRQVCDGIAAGIAESQSVDEAFRAIANEETLVANDVATIHQRNTQGLLFGRLDAVRDGAGRGLSAAQFGLQVDDLSIPGSLLDQALHASRFNDGILGRGAGPFGVFIAGSGTFATRDSSSREAGFDLSSFDLMGGIDYEVTERTVLGLAIGFNRSQSDINGGSELDAETFQIAAYGTGAITDELLIDGYAGYGLSQFELQRAISIPALSIAPGTDRLAQGRFDGHMVSAAGRLRYLHELDALNIETYGTVSYLHTDIDGYEETGAGGLSLIVGNQTSDSLAVTAGIRLDREFPSSFGSITPYLDLSYSRQLITDARNVQSRFAPVGADGLLFEVMSETPGENEGRFELGVEAQANENATFAIGLSGAFGDNGLSSYGVKAAVQWAF